MAAKVKKDETNVKGKLVNIGIELRKVPGGSQLGLTGFAHLDYWINGVLE